MDPITAETKMKELLGSEDETIDLLKEHFDVDDVPIGCPDIVERVMGVQTGHAATAVFEAMALTVRRVILEKFRDQE